MHVCMCSECMQASTCAHMHVHTQHALCRVCVSVSVCTCMLQIEAGNVVKHCYSLGLAGASFVHFIAECAKRDRGQGNQGRENDGMWVVVSARSIQCLLGHRPSMPTSKQQPQRTKAPHVCAIAWFCPSHPSSIFPAYTSSQLPNSLH